MNREKVQALKELLILQPYIVDVIYSEDKCDHDLNGFRDHYCDGRNLADMHLATHGFSWAERTEKWLIVDKSIEEAPVVLNRSFRYNNNKFPWAKVRNIYAGKSIFVGLMNEWEKFCSEFGFVRYYPTPTLLDVARVIAGSKLFIGNQSCVEAVCEGLKHNKILEISTPHKDSCMFRRMGAVYGYDEKVEFPEL